MAVIPASISRSSDALRWELLTETVAKRSLELLRLQRQLSTGQRLIVASEDPADGRLVLALQRSLERTEQYLSNVERGSIFLGGADAALGDVADLLLEVRSLGEQEVSTPSDADTRRAAAEAIGAIIDGVLVLANRDHGGRYLFAGLAEQTPPFELVGSAVLYRGSDGVAITSAAGGQPRAISVSGPEAFGAWAGLVDNHGDLDAIIAPSTLLEDLNAGTGVQTGTILVSDGTNSTTIDLSQAGDVYDVIHMMEAALPATTSVTIDRAANALVVASTLPGANIEIADIPGGTTARHLGIETPIGGCGSDTFVGADLDPLMSPLLSLDDIAGGATLDRTSGFIITNGTHTATVDISACNTFEDVINAINASGCYVMARIAPEGDRLQVISLLSGTHLTIGENGGQTATDLGLRTLHAGIALDEVNRGDGVGIVAGEADVLITFSDGSTASVNLDGAISVQDVLSAVAAAAPGRILARLTAVGNGIELEDLTGGAGTFSVTNGPTGTAASDLGLWQSVAAPATVITGDDVHPTVAENCLTHLLELREALLNDDTDGIAAATVRVVGDTDDLTGVRATIGVKLTGLEADEVWLRDERLVDQELLSLTRDLDYPTAVAQFTAMTALMEAALRMAATVAHLSLLDYL